MWSSEAAREEVEGEAWCDGWDGRRTKGCWRAGEAARSGESESGSRPVL